MHTKIGISLLAVLFLFGCGNTPEKKSSYEDIIALSKARNIETPEFINKMIVSIPFCRKIVYNTAIKTGFIEEGVNRQSFLKDGVFYDQWDLGLTKNEIRCLV